MIFVHYLAVSPGQPSSIPDDSDAVTLTGSSHDTANQINSKEIHWGVSQQSKQVFLCCCLLRLLYFLIGILCWFFLCFPFFWFFSICSWVMRRYMVLLNFHSCLKILWKIAWKRLGVCFQILRRQKVKLKMGSGRTIRCRMFFLFL